MCRVNYGGVEHLAGAVDDRDLAAGAVAGVKTEDDLSLDGRLHEELLEVDRENLHGVLGGVIRKLRADLALDRRENQAAVGVLSGGAENIGAERISALVEQAVDNRERTLLVEL